MKGDWHKAAEYFTEVHRLTNHPLKGLAPLGFAYGMLGEKEKALDIIKNNVVKAVSAIEGVEKVEVEFIFHPPWTSDRVSEAGREKLKEFGIAPPP